MLKNLLRERHRTAAVHALGVLDTPPEPMFDRLVETAASAFDAPVALISLIHDDRQWFKAASGLVIDCIPRNEGFCRFALDRPDVLECCDPLNDRRFANLPVVTGAPHVRYYIGAALRRLSGIGVGALCVADTVPRPPATPDQKAYLAGLARQVSTLLEARADRWGHAA